MLNKGYYIVEYNYRDKRGYVRCKRLSKGTFDLVIPIYKDFVKMIKNNDIYRPISKPRLLIVKFDNSEEEIDYKKELEEWRNMRLNKELQA